MAIPCHASSDDELILRIRAGDETAFDALVREHYNGLCLFAARMLDSRAVAEEVVQDVLLRIWQQRAQWHVHSSVAAYLYTAVRNQALNCARRERLLQRWQHSSMLELDIADGSLAAPDADERIREEEIAEALERAVQELPPRCRETFILRRQHHMSCAEIARVMQIAPKTVEIQIGIALKSLRRKLAHLL